MTTAKMVLEQSKNGWIYQSQKLKINLKLLTVMYR